MRAYMHGYVHAQIRAYMDPYRRVTIASVAATLVPMGLQTMLSQAQTSSFSRIYPEMPLGADCTYTTQSSYIRTVRKWLRTRVI